MIHAPQTYLKEYYSVSGPSKSTKRLNEVPGERSVSEKKKETEKILLKPFSWKKTHKNSKMYTSNNG
jgi:hypothetical protein